MPRSLFSRLLVVVWAVVVAFLIGGVSSLIWGALAVSNLAISPAIPWSVAVMALVLVLLWLYLGGRGWPQSTSQARRAFLRAKPVSRRVLGWALVAGRCPLLRWSASGLCWWSSPRWAAIPPLPTTRRTPC